MVFLIWWSAIIPRLSRDSTILPWNLWLGYLRRMAGQSFSAAKTLLFQVPWKFNILSTFATFAKFAKFAIFDSAREHPTSSTVTRRVPDPSQSAPSPRHPPSPGSTGRVPT